MTGWLLGTLAALLGQLPWRFLEPIGAVVGWLAGGVFRVRREHVEGAMHAAGIANPPRQARAMYASLGASALEFLWLANHRDAAARHVCIDDASAKSWKLAKERGRGVVIAASHTGNWDLAASAIARDLDLLVVTKRLSARSLDHFWQSTRVAAGVRLTEASGALARGRDFLRGGGAVAMMIDQVPRSSRHGVTVDFLGRTALADRAPAALAAASGAPLVVAACRRKSGGSHVLYVLEVVEPPPRPTPQWIIDATVSATRALDAFVRRHPSQWLWLHRRWKILDGARSARVEGVDHAAHGTTLQRSWRKIRSSSPDAASRAG